MYMYIHVDMFCHLEVTSKILSIGHVCVYYLEVTYICMKYHLLDSIIICRCVCYIEALCKINVLSIVHV